MLNAPTFNPQSSSPKTNMIITLTPDKININLEKSQCTLSKHTLEKLSRSGFIRRKTATYKLFINNRELVQICPLLKNPHAQNIVLWPSTKLPYRKHPVYVHLYAVALYLSSSLSMRAVATKVKEKFGLDKFSHTTISRSLKKLKEIAEELLELLEFIKAPAVKIKGCPPIKPVPRKHWEHECFKKYTILLKVLTPVLNTTHTIEYSSLLNYSYYNHKVKFII